MQWHEHKSARWEAEQRIGKQLLGDFRAGLNADGVAFVEGDFNVCSQHGHLYVSVRLQIAYPATFPARGQTPNVVLLSHRDQWRRGGDSHINDDWSLCLFVAGECRIAFTRADSLNVLFGVLQTFLFKEFLYQQDLAKEALSGEKAVWPGETRSHGLAGIVEAIRDKGGVGRNEACPCGSGKKFKICCRRRIQR